MAEAERHEYGRFRGNVLRFVVILGGDDSEKSASFGGNPTSHRSAVWLGVMRESFFPYR